MADPFTLAAIGFSLQGLGSLQQGFAADAAGSANARLAGIEGQAAVDAAAVDEATKRRETARQISRLRAGFSASGVTLEGSPLLAMAEQAAQGELDALTIRQRGAVAQTRAANEGRIARAEGRAARTGGIIGAGASVLTGASTLEGLGG